VSLYHQRNQALARPIANFYLPDDENRVLNMM
jgi:hypothetical protein